MEETSEVQTQGSDESVDSILAGVEASKQTQDIPMSAPKEPEVRVESPKEFDLTINGRQIKAPLDKVLKWAQMGYDAPNKIGEYNQKIQTYEQQINNYKGLENYKQVDEWAKANPDKWNRVLQELNGRAQNQGNPELDPNNPLVGELQSLKQELGSLMQFKDQLANERMAERRAKEDESLKGEVDGVHKDYPDIDLFTPDDEGKSLEYRVLEHAHKIGTNSFKTAFRDFYHDQLISRAQEQAKEALVKKTQKETKLGLIGTSQSPKKEITVAKNTRNQSYEDLVREALAEMG